MQVETVPSTSPAPDQPEVAATIRPQLWRPTNLTGDAAQSAASPLYRRCANLDSPAACNWLIEYQDPKDGVQDASPSIELCVSCSLNRTIPDLSIAENAELWHRIEIAKRRVLSSLLAMNLPVISRSQDAERGLAFDLLHTSDTQPNIMTGHDSGLITLDIEEADDSVRERVRAQMHEPYRTLLGHFRHEVGHYYWDQLIENSPWLPQFRELFGDETQDYEEALKRHYEQGGPVNWPEHFVTIYASAHPWEDWAETWAHYLHMVDTLATARSFRLDIHSVEMPFEGFGPDALTRPAEPDAEPFLELVNSWIRLSAVMNELSRSMGFADFYPFILSRAAVAKLHFVHSVIISQAANKIKVPGR